MFSQKTKDRINGWGSVLRFFTPILVTVGLWIMSDMKNEIRDIRIAARVLATETFTYNEKHLLRHSEFEKDVCERLSCIETVLNKS
jgi:hypothetical protein